MNRLARAVIGKIEPVGAPADVNVLEGELGADHAKISGCARTRSTSRTLAAGAFAAVRWPHDRAVRSLGQGTPP